jgi:hypothetical protein
MLKRPYPEKSAALMEKQDFAASMITEELSSFTSGGQDMVMSEDNFGDLPWNEHSRKIAAGDILRGMLIRGRLQAAVFNVFMQLCLQGACSLKALEHPVDWNNRPGQRTCLSWIVCMLGGFRCFRVNWDLVQSNWGIKDGNRWFDYHVPSLWLATMIGRSFTSLDCVFDIIRLTDQLGPIHSDSLQQLVGLQPDSAWKADMNLNRPNEWYGSGTFACWLPENIDAGITQQSFDNASLALSNDFYERLERMEMHYRAFFDIEKDVFDADVQQGERDVHDWAKENP